MQALTLLAPTGGLLASALPAAACGALALVGSQTRSLNSLRPRMARTASNDSPCAPCR